MNKKNDGPVGGRKRFLWSLLSLAIASLSVWAVTSQAKGFSPKNFSEYIDQNNPWWLAAAAVTMLAYIVLNAMMVDCLLKGFGFRQSFPKNISYAAADIYFSAITPSGGLTWLPRLVNINADEILVQQDQGFWRIPLSMLRAVVVERDDFGRRFLRLERTDDAASPPPMPISNRVSDADLAAFFERIGRASLFRAPARP